MTVESDNSAGLARFGIVQLFDTDWPDDLDSAGYPYEAQLLRLFIGGGELSDHDAVRLYMIMSTSQLTEGAR